MIAHIIFALPGLLVNPGQIYTHYPVQLGDVMAERYGQPSEVWCNAYQEIRRDWDNYWSDLNLSGDEPLADFREGMVRITRALFRLTGVKQPPKRDLIAFSRVLPELVIGRFDMFYPETRATLDRLRSQGFCLCAATYWTTGITRAALISGGINEYFGDRLIGMDTTNKFETDYAFLIFKWGLKPDRCLVVDRDMASLARARAAGMHTAEAAHITQLPDLLTTMMIERI